jgi:hypothetical protein
LKAVSESNVELYPDIGGISVETLIRNIFAVVGVSREMISASNRGSKGTPTTDLLFCISVVGVPWNLRFRRCWCSLLAVVGVPWGGLHFQNTFCESLF